MNRQYECLFIVANDVTEENRGKIVEKFSKMAGETAKVEKWGLKKFATPINHKKDGYYYLMNFQCAPELPKKMGDLMNITDGLVRYMFVCKDEQLQKKAKGKKAKKEVKEVKENE